MKRIVSFLTVVLLCAALVCPAAAAEFVPSISYKDGPDAVVAEQGEKDLLPGGEDVTDCIVVTSITGAKEKTTDISQEARDLLLDVYKQLSDGTVKLPLEGRYVIRELVDVSHKLAGCVETDHAHKPEHDKPGVVVSVKFDLGIGKGTDLQVLSYHDGQWAPAESVTINGDGTVTCVFEHFCPVVFCVDTVTPPQTGDALAADLTLWIVLLLASVAGMTGLLVYRRKAVR